MNTETGMTTVQTVLPDDLADFLVAIAKRENRSLSGQIRHIISEWRRDADEAA